MFYLGQYALSFALAFVISIVATLIVRAVSRKYGLVAKPRTDRWHKKPTALFGGIGIFAGFSLSYFFHPPRDMAGDMLLILCATGMFLIGLLDDVIELKPYAKLIAQIAMASTLTMFGLRLHWLPSPVLDQALTIFWLVGITNALNLLDNLDGLAGGVAAIAGGYLVYFCHVAGATTSAALCAAFVGALGGFLIFNFNPASIFMGDCGSLFVGFFLGGMTLINNQVGMRRNVLAVLTIPVLLLMIPILDTTLVTLSRRLAGRRVSQGGRDHASHRLVALGLSERAAALTLWSLAAASGGVAVVVHNISWAIGLLMVPVFCLVVLFFLIHLGRVSMYAPVSDVEAAQGKALLPTLADFTYKRRIFEVCHDLLIIVLAYYGAFLLRFDGALQQPYYHYFIDSLPWVIFTELAAFLMLGLYRGLWRYTSMTDLSTLVRVSVGAGVASSAAVMALLQSGQYSRGVLVTNCILLLLMLAGSRVSFRLMRTWFARLQSPAEGGKRVLIYGAGDGGELLLRELQNNLELGLQPIGFVDDDPQKLGRVIHGVRVLGHSDALATLLGAERVDEVVVSTKLGAAKSQALLQLCQLSGIHFRTLRIALE